MDAGKKGWISIMQTAAAEIMSTQFGYCQKTRCTQDPVLLRNIHDMLPRRTPACLTSVTIRLSTDVFLRQLLSMSTHQGVWTEPGPEWTVPTSASKPITV